MFGFGNAKISTYSDEAAEIFRALPGSRADLPETLGPITLNEDQTSVEYCDKGGYFWYFYKSTAQKRYQSDRY
ncbi:hypothetical protein N7523_007576 [Penicillium sp. IBT 18751x]|nr:hypothetical protein N7523_007576 [Penicillium sp. IBT 18751x]